MYPSKGLVIFLLMVLLVLLPVVYIQRKGNPGKIPGGIPVTVYARAEGKVYRLELEEYLVGVLAAEMPAEFALEALKAQAVAARTLTIQRLRRFSGKATTKVGQECPEADFSDDPGEDQAWLSTGSLRNKWGSGFSGYYRKIREAVRATAGVIMTYQGRPVDAVFHSTCGVGTVAADKVWQNRIPYLQNEPCGFDRHSPRYVNRFEFSWKELARRSGISEARLRQKGFVVRQKHPTGRVLEIEAGGVFFTGEKFRGLLGLTSSAFKFTTGRDGVVFTCIGYGHGVGLCQYGADGMAKKGYDFREILKHYYRGISFHRVVDNKK